MKRAALAVLGIVVGWWEFQSDLFFWIPGWSEAVDLGHIWAQFVVVGALAILFFGTAVFMSYRFLGWMLD